MVKGYKVFNSDWSYRMFQYEVGKVYAEITKPEVCKSGFHFCKNLIDCFKFYTFNPRNKVAEVAVLGEIVTEGNKMYTNKIQIIREIPLEEVLQIVNARGNNTGDRNSGDRNTGHRNSGDRNSGNGNSGNGNSGDRNSGYRNSGNWNSGNGNSGNWNIGDRNSGNGNSGDGNSGDGNSGNGNSGDWNSGDWNSGDWNKTIFSNGCFNTKSPKIYVFNRPSNWTYQDWLESEARDILFNIPYGELEWVPLDEMEDIDKEMHPESEITRGYLTKLAGQEVNRQKWWQELEERKKEVIKSLPNFDSRIFKEITGIDTEQE